MGRTCTNIEGRLLGGSEWPWRTAGSFTGGQIPKCLHSGRVQRVVEALSVCLKQMFTGKTYWIRRDLSGRIKCFPLCPRKSISLRVMLFYHKTTGGSKASLLQQKSQPAGLGCLHPHLECRDLP